MINQLIDYMVEEGLEVPSREDTYESIADAVANGTIRAIIKNGLVAGFFTWRPIYKRGKLFIYIENMCIKRKFRRSSNLLFLRKFFREHYFQRFEFVYWHNAKKDVYIYAK